MAVCIKCNKEILYNLYQGLKNITPSFQDLNLVIIDVLNQKSLLLNFDF